MFIWNSQSDTFCINVNDLITMDGRHSFERDPRTIQFFSPATNRRANF